MADIAPSDNTAYVIWQMGLCCAPIVAVIVFIFQGLVDKSRRGQKGHLVNILKTALKWLVLMAMASAIIHPYLKEQPWIAARLSIGLMLLEIVLVFIMLRDLRIDNNKSDDDYHPIQEYPPRD